MNVQPRFSNLYLTFSKIYNRDQFRTQLNIYDKVF